MQAIWVRRTEGSHTDDEIESILEQKPSLTWRGNEELSSAELLRYQVQGYAARKHFESLSPEARSEVSKAIATEYGDQLPHVRWALFPANSSTRLWNSDGSVNMPDLVAELLSLHHGVPETLRMDTAFLRQDHLLLSDRMSSSLKPVLDKHGLLKSYEAEADAILRRLKQSPMWVVEPEPTRYRGMALAISILAVSFGIAMTIFVKHAHFSIWTGLALYIPTAIILNICGDAVAKLLRNEPSSWRSRFSMKDSAVFTAARMPSVIVWYFLKPVFVTMTFGQSGFFMTATFRTVLDHGISGVLLYVYRRTLRGLSGEPLRTWRGLKEEWNDLWPSFKVMLIVWTGINWLLYSTMGGHKEILAFVVRLISFVYVVLLARLKNAAPPLPEGFHDWPFIDRGVNSIGQNVMGRSAVNVVVEFRPPGAVDMAQVQVEIEKGLLQHPTLRHRRWFVAIGDYFANISFFCKPMTMKSIAREPSLAHKKFALMLGDSPAVDFLTYEDIQGPDAFPLPFAQLWAQNELDANAADDYPHAHAIGKGPLAVEEFLVRMKQFIEKTSGTDLRPFFIREGILSNEQALRLQPLSPEDILFIADIDDTLLGGNDSLAAAANTRLRPVLRQTIGALADDGCDWRLLTGRNLEEKRNSAIPDYNERIFAPLVEDMRVRQTPSSRLAFYGCLGVQTLSLTKNYHFIFARTPLPDEMRPLTDAEIRYVHAIAREAVHRNIRRDFFKPEEKPSSEAASTVPPVMSSPVQAAA